MRTFAIFFALGVALSLFSLENALDADAAQPAEIVSGDVSTLPELEALSPQNSGQSLENALDADAAQPAEIVSGDISTLPELEALSPQNSDQSLENALDADAAQPAKMVSGDISALETPSSQNPDQQTKPEEKLHSHLQIGGNYTWAHISPKGLHSTSGNLGGIQALYEYKAPKTLYGALTLAWRQGNTENGNERSLCYVDTQERLGYTFGTWRNWWTCTLFTGFGYRHYGEDVSSSGDTITFNYNEFYLPFGFLTSSQVNSYFSVGVNFQWMPQVYPTVKITPLKGARWILTNEIANFRIEMPFTFTVSEKHHCFIVFEPFFEYWRDGRTTAETELGTFLNIPRNTYLFAGANLNIGVSF